MPTILYTYQDHEEVVLRKTDKKLYPTLAYD